MGKPADQTDEVVGVNDVDLLSPDRKVVRRRFVQSTLFPLKPRENKAGNSVDKDVKVVEEIDDDDDYECRGSQGRKGRGRKSKRNSTPQKRGSKKVAVDGKDASIIAVDDNESPDDGSPQKLKQKRRISTKNGRTNGNKGAITGKLATDAVATHQASQSVPDLRLEAKRTAEENSRIFAGKLIHPFFSSWKVGKKDHETTDVDINGCLAKRKEINVNFGPIHVFENVKDDFYSIDWSSWAFCDGTLSSTTCNQERMVFSFEGTVASLDFGAVLNNLNPLESSFLLEDTSLGQCPGVHEDTSVILASDSPVLVDEEMTSSDLLKSIEKDFEVNELGFISRDFGNASSDIKQQNAILQERIMSYYLNRSIQPENSLWTNKYQPEKAVEVCGNSEAVKFLNEWLHLWHATDFHVIQKSSNATKCSIQEDDYDSYDSDSDVEPGLKNVLLVKGPVGSGKSAAIYACAKEQGFQVLEVNASDWRSGALLKQKFGEAVGSHWLKRSQEYPAGSQSKINLNSSQAVFTNGAGTVDLNNSVIDEEDSVSPVEMGHTVDDRLPCDHGDIKTLILFEDVDATLCEDRGFISTIQQLADTGKRPMILTSNSENPSLPDNLDREEVCFTTPSSKELIHHIYLVCATEKAYLPPHLIERCIQFCRGDIRKTLMYLQFWCQSKGFGKDGEVQKMYSPMMFNLEAGHCTLPKLIPWELPSSLSEFVEAEIATSFCRMEEHHGVLEVIDEETGNTSMPNNMNFDKGEGIEAKKEAILRGNWFSDVDNDLIAVSNICEFSNSSGSPVAFTRRNVRRKLDTVLSSDSENEISKRENPAVSEDFCEDGNTSLVPDIDFHFPIPCSAVDDTSNVLGDRLLQSGEVKVELLGHQSLETVRLNYMNLSAVGESCNLSRDQLVHHAEAKLAEIQHEHLGLVNVNHSNWEAVNAALNQLNDQLQYSGDAKMEVDRNQLLVSALVHPNFSTIGTPGSQSSDRPIHSGEANAVEIQFQLSDMRNVNQNSQEAPDQCLNPLTDQLQHNGVEKVAVKRCLFSQTVHADPISCSAVSSPWNQSTDQSIHCGEANIGELQHQHTEKGNVNHHSQEAADDPLSPSFDHLLCHGKANMESLQHRHPETANMSPLSCPAVGALLNPLSDMLFRSEGEKGEEIEHQSQEATNVSPINCPAVDDSNQFDNQLFGIEKLEEIQHQHPGSANVNNESCPPLDDSMNQMSDQSYSEETKAKNIQHQLPETAKVDLINCPVVGNSMKAFDQLLQFTDADVEQHPCQQSEATNVNHIINQCQSIDMSCVPESTFVPETEVNDGEELSSGEDLTETVSPVTFANIGPPILSHKSSEYMLCDNDNLNARDEEMGDSQSENELVEASTSGCQVMDECSRMDFCKKSKRLRRYRLNSAKNLVQERWNELRLTDLKQHLISENRNALQVLQLADGMSNLMSEADLLLRDCKFLINDSLDEEIGLSEDTFTFGWHDQQVQMTSTIAQHGYCLYAKDTDALRSKMGIDNKVHLAWELLASTRNSLALGKLLRLDRRSSTSLATRSLNVTAPSFDIFLRRERERCLQNIVESIVPLRSLFGLRGNALHDYLSSLDHISRSEASRLAEAAENTKRRRGRVAKNYLTSGALDLSSVDISTLNEYNCYGKVTSTSKDAVLR